MMTSVIQQIIVLFCYNFQSFRGAKNKWNKKNFIGITKTQAAINRKRMIIIPYNTLTGKCQ